MWGFHLAIFREGAASIYRYQALVIQINSSSVLYLVSGGRHEFAARAAQPRRAYNTRCSPIAYNLG
jgi:hypothetical protein